MHTAEQTTSRVDAAAIFQRVLVPVDFSLASHRGVHVALELHRLCGARVCVFNVTHGREADQFLGGLGSPGSAKDLVEGSAAVQRFVNNIAPEQTEAVECDAKIAEDHVAAIRAKVSEWQATLLVLSHEPHSSVLRTHSEKLIKALSVPVLVLQSTQDSK